jgi:hypothetical protein
MAFDISNTILAKSDQLNADDLISAPRRIKITSVTQGNAENPVIVHYDGETGRPFKPCKTVRRILAAAWGVDAELWVGNEALLYCDPTVVYGGKEVGGIRIKALSGIHKRMIISLSKTRGQKVEHVIDILEPIELPDYPQKNFDANYPKWVAAVESGKMTQEQIINGCSAKANLSDEQKQKIRDIGKGEADLVIEEDESGFFNDGDSE